MLRGINNYAALSVFNNRNNGKDFSNRITAIVNKYRFSGKLSNAEWAELRKLSPQTYASVKACAYIKEQEELRKEQLRENVEIARQEKIEDERDEEARRHKRNRDRFENN
jgi:hypothetical protein